jgi:hypothetical protein
LLFPSISPLASLLRFRIVLQVLGKEKGPLGPFDVVARRSVPSYQRGRGDPITFTRVFDLSRMAFSPSNAIKTGITVSTAQRQQGLQGKI